MPARVTQLMPMLSVASIEAALGFYGRLLGGTESYRFPDEDPAFVSLRLGDGEIGLGRLGGEPSASPTSRTPTATW